MSRTKTVSVNIMHAVSQIGERVTNDQLRNASGIEKKYSLDIVKGRLAFLCREGYLRREGKGPQRRLYITPLGLDLLEEPENALWSPEQTISKPEPERVYASKERTCLARGCGKPFLSSWEGERICRSCKETVEWREGYDPEHYTAMGGR